MSTLQPSSEDTVIAFRNRVVTCSSLTAGDRMDVSTWREQAHRFGYDRLVIHERLADDPPEVGSYLSVYRRGEPWSRFGITRMAGRVLAWCCRTGSDIGRFETVAEALMALLPAEMAPLAAAVPITSNVVRLS